MSKYKIIGRRRAGGYMWGTHTDWQIEELKEIEVAKSKNGLKN